MLNIYYWYAAIWGTVLILYSLGWSDFCTKLDPTTTTFFFSSIFISIILGLLFRNRFKYKGLQVYPDRTRLITNLIIALSIIQFIYCKDIPLITIIAGKTLYSDFKGIPLLNPILENLIVFYSTYLFYIFIEFKNKNILREIIELLIINLLMFQKGILILNIFCLINLAVAKGRSGKHKITIQKFMLILFIISILIYINGGLANLRSGVSWNNTSFAIGIGKINQKWPKWLPMQFSWAYSYIVSPLANLNYNIIHKINLHSFSALFATLLPESIVKHIWPDFMLSNTYYLLITPVMNACTGFIESVLAFGSAGLWFYFSAINIIYMIILSTRCRQDENYRCVFIAIMCMMIFGLFFYNTLRTAATSFLLLLIIIEPFTRNVRFSIKGWMI